MNFFMEIAKLRAARDAVAPRDDASWARRTSAPRCCARIARQSGVSLTEQDPYNNVMRTTIEAMAAMLGGTQSLHTNALDEAIALPTDFSARIARNTQIVIQEETGMTKVVDPLGGSYYVESLTQQLVDGAWEIIERVEARRRDGEGGRRGLAQGDDRGGLRGARGAGRSRRGRDRRGQQIPQAGRGRRSTSSTSTIVAVREAQVAADRAGQGERDEALPGALDALRAGARSIRPELARGGGPSRSW